MAWILRSCCLLTLGLIALAGVSCNSSNGPDYSASSRQRTSQWNRVLGPVPVERKVTPVQMLGEVNLKQSFIRPGTVGRKLYRPMKPLYVTIHATENYSPGATAWQHARALHNGALRAHKRKGGNRIGFLTWHFTMQQDLGVQHLPTTEQGEHADFDGPGNNHSIGIEMCENQGNNIARTIDRTAKLTAFLMWQHNIPARNVVPHYHWPRAGVSPEHKDCPHFLLDGKRPGPTWNWFLDRVKAHRDRIVPGPTPRL